MGLHHNLLQLLMHPNVDISTPAFRSLAHILFQCPEVDVSPLFESSLMATLHRCVSTPLCSKNTQKKKGILDVLHELTGTEERRRMVVESPILPFVVSYITTREIAVCNAAVSLVNLCICRDGAGHSGDIITAFIKHGLVDALIVYLSKARRITKMHYIRLALASLESLLQYGCTLPSIGYSVTNMVIQSGGINVLSALQSFPNDLISWMAQSIQKTYFL
eukprot:gnl/Dysnectes_brevis/9668_a18238_193.p1 GENE.gnl/Dysnectes_brevis/9668_a18238_193~~gnl/Dysnectes_brevis/9668_a18238_193.p1  ORF type:complete len:220 (+),score=12.30 gnl/Dysnectes_brevis/9668_a18238_193:555-1214(+)